MLLGPPLVIPQVLIQAPSLALLKEELPVLLAVLVIVAVFAILLVGPVVVLVAIAAEHQRRRAEWVARNYRERQTEKFPARAPVRPD